MLALYIVIAVVLLILISIGGFLAIKPNMKIAFKKYAPQLAERASFQYVTRDLEHDDIYTKRGAVRQRIAKKVQALTEELESYYAGYETEFFEMVKPVLDEKNRFRKKDLPEILELYLNFVFEKKRQLLEKQNADLVSKGLTLEQFFDLRNLQAKNGGGDSVGVYIIFNESKRMYYVGQAKRLFFRVNQHFTGHGNGDVYADYKYGDRFFVQLIPITSSGYSDIDALERDMIAKYRADSEGYNRTSGNTK